MEEVIYSVGSLRRSDVQDGLQERSERRDDTAEGIGMIGFSPLKYCSVAPSYGPAVLWNLQQVVSRGSSCGLLHHFASKLGKIFKISQSGRYHNLDSNSEPPVGGTEQLTIQA
jgi:hypothetical protein